MSQASPRPSPVGRGSSLSPTPGPWAALWHPRGMPPATQAAMVSNSVLCQTPVAGKMAATRVGLPGRHAAFFGDFLDHAAMLDGVLIGQEREGRRLFGPAAHLAACLQDRSDVLAVGDKAARAGLIRGTADETAVCFCLGDADFFPGQHLVECLRKVVASRLGPACTAAILVIDAAPVIAAHDRHRAPRRRRQPA